MKEMNTVRNASTTTTRRFKRNVKRSSATAAAPCPSAQRQKTGRVVKIKRVSQHNATMQTHTSLLQPGSVLFFPDRDKNGKMRLGKSRLKLLSKAMFNAFKNSWVSRYVNTVPHGQTSTVSAVEKVAAKLEMPTFNNQNGVWATFLLLPVVCWHGAFAAQAILEPVILRGGGR